MLFDAWLLFYLALGAVVGVFAGLFGVGGGAIQVPLMTMAFAAQGFDPEHILHMALGTGMATICFTSLSSLRAHHLLNAVDWTVLRQLTPGIVVGGFAGSLLARVIPTFPLAVIFTVFVFYAATNMLISWKPKPQRSLPGALGMFVAGFLICAFSALVAIGGAALTIPFLVFCNMPFHRAIGTSAAVGFPLALASTVGYIVNGYGQVGVPPYSIGYVYLPALIGIAIGSVLLAPFGARLAHRMPTRTLKRVFAAVMYVLATKLLVDLWK